MPIYKLQTEFSMDSTLPRDVLCITPHFNDGGVGSDPEQLCQDLAEALALWTSPKIMQITVTAYVADAPPPSYPVADHTVNIGIALGSSFPREIALCLSYYSERNIPRSRGRLYIPFPVMSNGQASLAVRPNSPTRAYVGQLAAIFADLGGVDVDWCLYSRADDQAKPVTNWWVDDEWDTVRSRGLRPTTRTEGVVNEG